MLCYGQQGVAVVKEYRSGDLGGTLTATLQAGQNSTTFNPTYTKAGTHRRVTATDTTKPARYCGQQRAINAAGRRKTKHQSGGG